ncbi:MAG: DegT/DnrJ/EryC1/StrS family aminotransferase [Fibrobacterales bacterium]|nr:DegT/DnrJ/EryC1/StrS family aminotransferase [Fibrobacterales bacterium]
MTPDPIPFQNFVRAQAPYQRELEEAAVRVLRAGRYIMGDELAAFEEEFARFCGKRFCVGVGNGLDALTLALTAGVKDVRPGD